MRKTRKSKASQSGLWIISFTGKDAEQGDVHSQVQQKTIRLLSQLLRQHWKTHHGGLQGEEGGHE
jgi:hypothetical protein